jgi:uncharacterized protein
MSVLDAFSFLDTEHPARQAGEIRYVVAPARGPVSDLAALQAAARGLARVAGGLLPVLGPGRETLLRELRDPWWRGLLLSPGPQAEAVDDPEALARLALDGQRPVVVECGLEGFSRPEHLRALLERCGPRPIVLTHGGQLNISGQHLREAGELFRRHPHTLLETSGIYRQDFLEAMLHELGPGRILYGSGHPLMDERLELERVAILPIGPDEKADILGRNAERLYGL